MKHTHCTSCGRELRNTGLNQHGNARCLICRTAQTFRGWRYTSDPYAVVEYR